VLALTRRTPSKYLNTDGHVSNYEPKIGRKLKGLTEKPKGSLSSAVSLEGSSIKQFSSQKPLYIAN